jgi:hypothetical protein
VEDKMTKAKAIELITTGYARLEGLLAEFSEMQMIRKPVQDHWTIKDTLAHITAWHNELLTWLRNARFTGNPGVPRFNDDYVNKFNADNYEANQDRPLSDIRREFEESYAAVIAEVQAMPDDPAQYSMWRNGLPPWHLIAGNTYEHYDEHIRWISQSL